MTEKLYHADSHIFDFDAKILEITETERGYAIVLDKTAFFPEGGGQKADEGIIDSCDIYDVYEKDDIIYHLTKKICDANVGDTVHCRLNASLRFARMQAHSGEHIVSGIAHNLFGVSNVGFHFDGLVMTVDFDMPLTKEQIAQIEFDANECVYACLPVTARLYDREELQKISFRSKLDFPGPARIVEIEGIDKCACCAPHVTSTGEIGCIKILSCISHRGGVRITLICGIEAYRDYCSKYRQTLNISSLLCAKHDETDIAVNKLLQTNQELRNTVSELKTKYLKYIADSVCAAPFVFAVFPDIRGGDLRELCNMLSEKAEYAVILLSGDDSSSYSYCIYSDKLNLSAFVFDFNSLFNGTGGGRGTLMQGKIRGNVEDIRKFVDDLKVEKYENA